MTIHTMSSDRSVDSNTSVQIYAFVVKSNSLMGDLEKRGHKLKILLLGPDPVAHVLLVSVNANTMTLNIFKDQGSPCKLICIC